MKSNINENDYEITVDMLNQMNELRVTDGKIEDILNSEKGSRVAGAWIGSTRTSSMSRTICIHMIDLMVASLFR